MSDLNRTQAVMRAGQRGSFRGLNLAGVDLSNLDLRDLDFEYADLSGANLNGAILSGANLSRATLHMAKCRNANLEKANLAKADLPSAVLTGSKMSGADLAGANMEHVHAGQNEIAGAKVSGVFWPGRPDGVDVPDRAMSRPEKFEHREPTAFGGRGGGSSSFTGAAAQF